MRNKTTLKPNNWFWSHDLKKLKITKHEHKPKEIMILFQPQYPPVVSNILNISLSSSFFLHWCSCNKKLKKINSSLVLHTSYVWRTIITYKAITQYSYIFSQTILYALKKHTHMNSNNNSNDLYYQSKMSICSKIEVLILCCNPFSKSFMYTICIYINILLFSERN